MPEQTEIVAVPGARLYTERTGDGPALLLIAGGGGDAGLYDKVVPLLARHYTVITYDRRGNSRSPLNGLEYPLDMAEQAADAVAILDYYGVERADVFGSSSGGTVVLELLARHGGRVHAAVAHDPPVMTVLPDREEQLAFFDEVGRVAERESALRGYLLFSTVFLNPPWTSLLGAAAGRAAVAGLVRAYLAVRRFVRWVAQRPGPDLAERYLGNLEFLLRREMPVVIRYEPDADALRAVGTAWCLATGAESAGRVYSRPARVLGERLGVACEEFPGDHGAYARGAEEFAGRLVGVLDGLA